MKAILRLELIGDDMRMFAKYVDTIASQLTCGATKGHFSLPSRSWCAEITGFDDKYKYARRFLHGHKDYTESNSKGSRGVYGVYVLESGHVYDVAEALSWTHVDRRFCTVTEDGDINKLTEEMVIEWLNGKDPSALTYSPQPTSA